MTGHKAVLSLALAAASFSIAPAAFAQNAPRRGQAPAPVAAETKPDKAAAYYHYSLAHLYAELAATYNNRGDYFTRAIENYRLALKADPTAGYVSEELSDLYIQSGRLREAVSDAEEALKVNPNDLNARRLLARIYARLIGEGQQGRADETYVRKAIEQYSRITEADPKDGESWLMLGRLHKLSSNSVEAEKSYKKALEANPDNEDALTGLAMVYVDLGDTKSAAEALKKVAEKNPSGRSLAALASAYEQMREYGLAAEALRKAVEVAPGNNDLKRALAQNLMLADQFDESLKIYQAIVADEPRDIQSLLRISQIYRQKRDFAKARQAGAKAREIEPNNLEVRYNEVNLLEAEGKSTEALAAMKDMVTSTAKRSYAAPERANRALLLERLGVMYRAAEQFDPAVETFRQIAELDADLGGRAVVQVVETYRQAKQFGRAEKEAQAALAKFGSDRTLRSVYAAILADSGKTDAAVAELKKLLGEKKDRDVFISLAQVYEKGKRYTDMAQAIDEAEKLSPDKDDKETVYFMRGAMFEKLKKFDQAEAEFRKVLEMNPGNAAALNYLGYMLADRNVRLQEALEMISKAVEKEPSNPAYLDSLGWVYFRLGRYTEAETQLQASLERMTKDPTVHDHLGDVYFKQGKLKEAIMQWERSLKEWEGTAPADQDHTEIAKVQKKVEGAKVRLARETSAVKP